MSTAIALAHLQLDCISKRARFLSPLGSVSDMSWHILLLMYICSDDIVEISPVWEKDLNLPASTIWRYLELLHAHGFVLIARRSGGLAPAVSLNPEKRIEMDALLAQMELAVHS